MSDNGNTARSYVTVYTTGGVRWHVTVNFQAQCQIDVYYYPFDSQACDLIVRLSFKCELV